MKKLCFLLAIVFLLSGCSLLQKQKQELERPGFDYAVGGEFDENHGGGIYISQDGTLMGGIGDKVPNDEIIEDEADTPEQPENTFPFSGKWQYVDIVVGDLFFLTINDAGGAEIEQYYQRDDGTLSLLMRMSCPPEIEDGRITFPGDTEYDPPSLVLQYEYVEGVGEILDVVSSESHFSSLTEYFHRVFE